MFRITYRPHRLETDGFEETTAAPDSPAKIAVILKNRRHEGVTPRDAAQWLLRSERARRLLRGANAELYDDTPGPDTADLPALREALLQLGAQSVLPAVPAQKTEPAPVYSALLEIDLSMIVPAQP